jgi:hypothetical protein
MNARKFAAAITMATLLCPAIANAATTKTGTVTVKWNSQALAALTLHTDYNASGTFNGGTAAGKIDLNANAGTGTCTAADPTNADGTTDFGNVSVDAAKFTDCQYESAINAIISTSSSNWNLTEALSAAPPAGYSLCAYANDGTKTFASFNAASLPVTTTSYGGAATSNTNNTACASNGQLLGTTAFTAATNTNQFTVASPANIGEDLELVMANNAASGATSVTLTYTLTAN